MPLRHEGGVHARIGILLNSEHPHRVLTETARLSATDDGDVVARAA